MIPEAVDGYRVVTTSTQIGTVNGSTGVMGGHDWPVHRLKNDFGEWAKKRRALW